MSDRERPHASPSLTYRDFLKWKPTLVVRCRSRGSSRVRSRSRRRCSSRGVLISSSSSSISRSRRSSRSSSNSTSRRRRCRRCHCRLCGSGGSSSSNSSIVHERSILRAWARVVDSQSEHRHGSTHKKSCERMKVCLSNTRALN